MEKNVSDSLFSKDFQFPESVFVKFTKSEDEVRILEYLSSRQLESDMNHCVKSFYGCAVLDGYLVVMEDSGVTVDYFVCHRSTPNDHLSNMWSVALQLIQAVKFLHCHDIAHRDIKPKNILIQSDGRLVLSDFGIASLARDGCTDFSSSKVGTENWIAPEVVRSVAPYSKKLADVFACGKVIRVLADSCIFANQETQKVRMALEGLADVLCRDHPNKRPCLAHFPIDRFLTRCDGSGVQMSIDAHLKLLTVELEKYVGRCVAGCHCRCVYGGYHPLAGSKRGRQ